LAHLRGGEKPPAAAAQEGSRSDPLAEVRAKLAQLTASPLARQATDSAGDQAHKHAARDESLNRGDFLELPFVRIETPDGPLHQRTERLNLSDQVGQFDLNLASAADPELLALLALDSSLANCAPGGALFFDTETTGLGGAGTVAFLVGLAWRDQDGRWVLEQLLLRHPSEERALLLRVSELIARASFLVSFNGRSFDLPLLKSRHVMNHLPELPTRPHLDLLHVARRVHKRRLERCRLIDVETQVLGFLRGEDDIPGAEIAPRYGHFLRTGDEEALRAVVLHNAFDVTSMVALLGLYGQRFGTEHVDDLCSMGETLLRAKDLERAEDLAHKVMASGATSAGLRLRAEVRKVRGDVARALLDFQQAALSLDDPALRLTLAKLYEHHARDFERALQLSRRGTGESDAAVEKRQNRLHRKIETQLKRASKPPSRPH